MGGGVSKAGDAHGKKVMAKEGDSVPIVNIIAWVRHSAGDDASAFTFKDISTKELFEGKRVVVFSIPGAFTPVCSCDHMPSYQKRYDDIMQMGVDEVYCISVNDAFVMRQWGLMQGLQEETELDNKMCNALNPGNFRTIKLIPDGNAKFSRAMGMTCKWENIGGFGERSWRYSAVFNNMNIEKLFLEEDGNTESDPENGPFVEITGGNVMLDYLQSKKMRDAATGGSAEVKTATQ